MNNPTVTTLTVHEVEEDTLAITIDALMETKVKNVNFLGQFETIRGRFRTFSLFEPVRSYVLH